MNKEKLRDSIESLPATTLENEQYCVTEILINQSNVLEIIDQLEEPETFDKKEFEALNKEFQNVSHQLDELVTYIYQDMKIKPMDYKDIVSIAIDLLKKNKKEKPVVPQFVADWIEYCKKCYWDLSSFLSLENMAKSKAPISKENRRLLEKYRLDGNVDAMARAWLDGYEVEETLYYMPLPYQSNSTIYYYKQDDGKISFKQGGMMKDHSKFTKEELDKYFPEIKHMAEEVQE